MIPSSLSPVVPSAPAGILDTGPTTAAVAPVAGRVHPFGTPPGQALVMFPLSVGVLVAALLAAVLLSVGAAGLLPGGVVPDRLARRFDDAAEPGVPAASELPEEERFVVELLRRNDGHVRQSRIVEASDWSKSKVSRLLSTMESEGRIRKIPVGRENVIALPGVDPE